MQPPIAEPFGNEEKLASNTKARFSILNVLCALGAVIGTLICLTFALTIVGGVYEAWQQDSLTTGRIADMVQEACSVIVPAFVAATGGIWGLTQRKRSR